MLTHLSVQHFAIVNTLQLELYKGMTTITGETGAGKSIAIDALSLCLGARADASVVRQGEDKTELCATFTLDDNPNALRWLQENELLEGNECILRRVITKEGRSRAFINGNTVPLSQLKLLGQHLISIHGQHAHQLLTKAEYQLTLLDQYAGHYDLLNQTRLCYQHWRLAHRQHAQLQEQQQQYQAQLQLLAYQIKELDELNIAEHEFNELEQEHKQLASCGERLQLCQQALSLLSDNTEVNLLEQFQSLRHCIDELAELDPRLNQLPSMLEEAVIQLEEANSELNHYLNSIDVDPDALLHTEERYSRIISLAKKHYVQPQALYQHHQLLKQQIAQLASYDDQLAALSAETEHQYQQFLNAAEKLHQSRSRYAQELEVLITQSMQELSMEQAQFKIALTQQPDHPSPLGYDGLNFLVSTNLGQPLQPLAKVASGGELSRISLAIQVITAQKVATPSLIFDEVDVGISGPTAAVVGKMLRQLGQSTQVLCVTHLPQVAGCGHQQLCVTKHTVQGQIETQMQPLDTEQRINELARLLGGSQITASTLANARELLIAA